jgi:hypothetical protein
MCCGLAVLAASAAGAAILNHSSPLCFGQNGATRMSTAGQMEMSDDEELHETQQPQLPESFQVDIQHANDAQVNLVTRCCFLTSCCVVSCSAFGS